MRLSRCYGILVLASALIFTISCEDRGSLSGKYVAHSKKDQILPAVSLELKGNGEGTWATEEDNVSFKWEVRGSEIWLLTKSGGVIVGKIVDSTIEVSLPGLNVYYFRKVK